MTMRDEMASDLGMAAVSLMSPWAGSSEERSRVRMRRSFCAVIFGAFLCVVPVGAAFAQARIIAGSVNAVPGTTAIVPINMVLPAGMPCATMQFKLTVVPSSGAPALETNVSFASSVGPASQNFNHGPATVLVGWFSSFSPLLTGAVQVGTLSIPISADAQTGDTYAVTVFNPSGTTDTETDLPMGGVNGAVTVGENAPVPGGGRVPAAGIGEPPPPVAESGSVAPAQPRAGTGAPAGAPVAPGPKQAVPAANEPQPTGGIPVPAATAAEPAKAAAEQPTAGPAPPSRGAPPVATAGGEAPAPAQPVATNSAAPKRPSPTVKAAAPLQVQATPAKTGGCQCQLDRQANSSGALLLIPLVALLKLRRRHRESRRVV